MAVTKKYNVFRSGKLIGEYTAVDAAKKLGCSAGIVRVYAHSCRKLRGEYTFEEAGQASKWKRNYSMRENEQQEWEEVCQRFKCSGIDLSKIKIRPVGGDSIERD